ncbi:MAG: sugar phosphate isomerase/epimerase family protein [Bryobacteraceae bacterium]|nr:sugar phosphate isomerase/epimerase family protein [Bryobacteraceae bacterium]
MKMTRRQMAALLAAAPLARAAKLSGLKIGVTDWNLKMTSNPDAVALASRIGFAGVEVSLGRKVVDNKLPLDNPELIARYREAFRKEDFRPAGTCLDVLHVNYLKNDKLGQKWLVDGIRLTKELGAKVMLMPFFGKGALQTQEEKDYVGDVLREIGPQAEKAGIALGLEDTISAEDNVRIMERSRSKAVLTYYDIGNSTNNGFAVVREIEWLGKKRICQLHFKDNPGYLGDGKINLADTLRAVSRIGFEGFANLETDSPSKVVETDMKRNLSYVMRVVEEVRRG